MATQTKNTVVADSRTRKYYVDSDSCEFLWIRRYGIDSSAVCLLYWLRQVGNEGLSEKAFFVKEIDTDLQRMRQLDFDDKDNTLTLVSARLEYNLTRAVLRYAYGQRYGFVNPYKAYNYYDVEKEDSTGRVVKYRGLFDISVEQPESNYDQTVIDKVRHDSIDEYLREIQPKGELFGKLKDMLAKADSISEHNRIVCNLERCRWRNRQPIKNTGKHIVVNIPAFHLYAYTGNGYNAEMDMKVVCGAVTTKTPQLSSKIEWMEINPQWVIPMSIIKKEVAQHAGDSSYFNRRRYNIYDKATNKIVSGQAVSRQMLLSGKYRIAQSGGTGNSLGRIVFRFKNNFSVFLHDTSTPSAFDRTVRALSHGCVRISKPFDLSQFVLDNPDEWLAERIRIAMGLPAETERGINYAKSHTPEEKKKLINWVKVAPAVPIHIIYYTLWYDKQGNVTKWPDIYAYDQLILNHLHTYLP